MAEDYLTDDEQWEAVKRWIVENGLWVVAGVVLGVGGLFGYRYVENSRNDRGLRASTQFTAMSAALERNDQNKSRQLALDLIKNFPSSPYADQAQLLLARLSVDEGQLPGAVAPLTQVMSNSKDSELRHIARMRLARVLTAQGKPDEALTLLSEDAPGAFAARYHEVRGDAFYAKKDLQSAQGEYQSALSGADGGNVDAALLQVKIADLGSSVAVPAVVSSNKAKP